MPYLSRSRLPFFNSWFVLIGENELTARRERERDGGGARERERDGKGREWGGRERERWGRGETERTNERFFY